MSRGGLSVGPDLTLPLDTATQTLGILAKKGAGKSNAAVVLAEELFDAGVPWVAIDPKGDYWGVRSSADGTRPGLPVVVFGGKHGDVPLEPGAGALVADLILGDEDRGYLSCVLDVSQFTISEQRRFLLDFGERLFRRKDEERVLHLFLEEAHEYLPQSVPRDSARLVSTWQRIVKQGRFKGLGVTVVSQRSAALNKDVLTQVDSLIVLRTLSPQDRAAVKGWVEVHAGGVEIVRSLHELAPGEAWLWSPERLEEPVRFRFRRRRTFDSGATPKVGEVRAVPRTLADVDLAAVKEAMADAIDKAKADDPAALRKRIRDLEQQLAAVEPAVVEVPVVSPEDRVVLAGLGGHMVGLNESLTRLIERFEAVMGPRLEKLPAGSKTPALGRSDAVRVGERGTAVRSEPPRPTPRTEAPHRVPRAPIEGGATAAGRLGKAERSIVAVLAQHGDRTKTQVAVLAGYSHKGGGFNNAVSALRTAGLVEGRDILTLTEAGRAAAGDVEPLPTGSALVEWWSQRLGQAERLILDLLVQAWPEQLTKQEIADATHYVVTGGGFNNALSRLRSLELIHGRTEIAASDMFADVPR